LQQLRQLRDIRCRAGESAARLLTKDEARRITPDFQKTAKASDVVV
jgi:hypothetical protein